MERWLIVAFGIVAILVNFFATITKDYMFAITTFAFIICITILDINYMLNRGIHAVRAGIEVNKATLASGDGTTTATYTLLNQALGKFGDASSSIVAWVMNGKSFHDLVGDGLANVKTDNVAGQIVATGSTGTMGRPAFVTDSDGLVMKDIATGLVDTSSILGLTVGALTIAETEAREIFSETVSGKENLKTRIQAESDVLRK